MSLKDYCYKSPENLIPCVLIMLAPPSTLLRSIPLPPPLSDLCLNFKKKITWSSNSLYILGCVDFHLSMDDLQGATLFKKIDSPSASRLSISNCSFAWGANWCQPVHSYLEFCLDKFCSHESCACCQSCCAAAQLCPEGTVFL